MLDCELRQGVQAEDPLGPTLRTGPRNCYSIWFAKADDEDPVGVLPAANHDDKTVPEILPQSHQAEESGAATDLRD